MAQQNLPIRLIVGLGNPGPDYVRTRHNAGFRFVDMLAGKLGAHFHEERKFQGETARCRIAGHEVWLLKPLTFMNASGEAVSVMANYFKITPAEVLVAHDEMDLLPGCMRIKKGGGNAGHNGLKSITQQLGTPDFWRLRLGIGHPRTLGLAQQVFDFVLSAPSSEHEEAIRTCALAALETAPLWAEGEMEKAHRAIAAFGTPKKPAPPQKPDPMVAPAVLISRCLLGEHCRYDGRLKPSILEHLAQYQVTAQHVRWVPICPEVDGGLPVPRQPCEICPGSTASDVLSGRSKICSCHGDDASDPYVRGAKLAVIAAQTLGAQFALLKARSPSCSPDCIYDGTFSGRLVPGRGIAAQALADVGIELFSEETVEVLIDRIRSINAAVSV